MATQTRKPPETTPPQSRAAKARDRARKFAREVRHGRFSCTCSPGKNFRGHKALNAHHLSRHGGYWAGDKAKRTGRKIGKDTDALRKHARGWLEAHGHVDRMGKRTDRARSRPERPERSVWNRRTGRAQARHGRDIDNADKLKGKAGKAREAGNGYRADSLKAKEAELRGRHPVRQAPARPARAPKSPPDGRPSASANGQLPGRTGRAKPARAGRSGR